MTIENNYEVVTESGCWIWLGATTRDGYGKIYNRMATSFFYEKFIGPIPTGLEPDHLCKVRCCINPYHVELVTHKINCRRGSQTKLTEEQVLLIRLSDERQRIIARKFGCSQAQVSRIKTGLNRA